MTRRAQTRRMPGHAVITDARVARSDDIERRMRRYALTMLIRTACFIGLFLTHGPARWAMLAGAALLPAIAVVLANAADNRSLPMAAPQEAETLPMAGELTSGVLIPGELHEDEPVVAAGGEARPRG